MTVPDCARICYAACRVASIAAGKKIPIWGRARAEEKVWMRHRVNCVFQHHDIPLSGRHDAWCEIMGSEGWKLGDLDYAKKTHPHLANFEKLPDDERFKCQLVNDVALACFVSE